jgi:hypothetical protein
MCYYSTTLRSTQTRSAIEGEDLVLTDDRRGHHFPMASDGKIVCMTPGSEVHIASLKLSEEAPRGLRLDLAPLIGKPVDAHFIMRGNGGYAADRIVIEYHEVHFLYLAPGTTFYTGPKQLDVAEKLGVNDPSITLDHMPDPKEGEAPAAPAEDAPAQDAPKQGDPAKEPAAEAPVA